MFHDLSPAVVLSTGLYVVCSAAETVLVKTLNYRAGISLPIFTALLVNLQWLFQLPQLFLQRKTLLRTQQSSLSDQNGERVATRAEVQRVHPSRRERALLYLLTGLLTFAITLGRNVGVNALPGSFFVLLISTSVVFNIALSKCFLKRRINRFHVLAGLLCVCAAGIGGFASRQDVGGQYDGTKWIVGVPSTVAAALFIATMSVTADRAVSTWSHRDLRITEMTIVASLVAGVLLIPLVFILDEKSRWETDLPRAYNSSVKTRAILITVSVVLPLTKALIRQAKYTTISHTSALFFEFVQASASLFSSLANVLLFPANEPFSWTYLGSLLSLALAFVVYARGRMLEKKVLEELAEEAQLVPEALVFPDAAEPLSPSSMAAAKAGMKPLSSVSMGPSSLPFSPKTSEAMHVEMQITDEGDDEESRQERMRASAVVLPPRPPSTITERLAKGFLPFRKGRAGTTVSATLSKGPNNTPAVVPITLMPQVTVGSSGDNSDTQALFAIDSDSISLTGASSRDDADVAVDAEQQQKKN